MKKKLTIITIIILVLALSVFAFFKSGLYTKLLTRYQTSKVPCIVCIGDSLTHGTGGEGVAYPLYLEEQLRVDSIYVPVVNLGVGGENTLTIAGRMGAIPFKTTQFIIPEDGALASLDLIGREENRIDALVKGIDGGINPCSIAGISGTLSYTEENGYTFSRSENGESVEVSEGTEIETYASSAYEDGIYILFMGENGGFDNNEELIAQQEAVISKQIKNSGKFIIIGLTTGNNETRAELDRELEDRWGEHFLNVREYMITEGIAKSGLTLSEKDLSRVEKGRVPECLRMDDIHFNEAGYHLLAEAVYERLRELGYLDF